jgi:hypothetical protein
LSWHFTFCLCFVQKFQPRFSVFRAHSFIRRWVWAGSARVPRFFINSLRLVGPVRQTALRWPLTGLEAKFKPGQLSNMGLWTQTYWTIGPSTLIRLIFLFYFETIGCEINHCLPKTTLENSNNKKYRWMKKKYHFLWRQMCTENNRYIKLVAYLLFTIMQIMRKHFPVNSEWCLPMYFPFYRRIFFF